MESAVKGKAKRKHLNAEDCSELVSRPEGSHALTQPHAFDRSNSHLNRGLYPRSPTKYPRTPTKRKKLDGDTERNQRDITQFFPVTGVMRVSPQKTAQPCSSITTERINNILPLKTESILAETLATAIKEEPEDEVVDHLEGLTEAMFGNDEEFERGASAQPPGYDPALVKEEGEDYLEGLTEAMFGDDEEFERGATAEQPGDDPAQVEALPDAHYGLLGSSSRLVQPKGQMEDLPEEVLRFVFGLLPAKDLYRQVSLVCHHWRDIITESLFVPWKKLYFRYQMGEKKAVNEVNLLLRNRSIIKENHLSVINMIKYMAEYKPGQRVKPEAVLQSVRRHRLFPQAEACLKHRMPEIEGIEGGPNPWAAMALILVLCPSVVDILDLVARLKVSMPSVITITEYLSVMATMLLAMTDRKINVSSRLYYNIFYVLHLMENASPIMSTSQSGRSPVRVTHEQQQILNHTIQRDHVVKIVAFAGTGKTTTLIRYTQQRPHLHFLYVAFNKSVAQQAKGSFPGNVDCKTVHSMAYGAVGRMYMEKKKLSFNLRPFSVASWLPKGRGGFINAKVVTHTLNSYMASADTHITTEHVPLRYRNTRGQEQQIDHEAKQMYVRDAQAIWDKMVDLVGNKGFHMTHDGYLKLWQLGQPCLDQYDVILIDEAQDCTPAIMDIMMSQRCGKVLVGDPHQQIYTFRGAVNALRLLQHTHLFYLTQSFRFGAEIAYVGASILQVCKHVKKILVGGRQEGSVTGKASDVVAHAKSGLSLARGETAILSRCNVTVFSEAVRLTDVNPSCRLHIVGGVENFGLQTIKDIWLLMQPRENRTGNISDGFIRRFTRDSLGGYSGLKDYATKTEDQELLGKLAVVEKYNSRIPQLVERIRACSEHLYQNADFILGTVHKSKGLEFDTVVVTDDFAKIPVARHNLQRVSFSTGDIPEDEWNLLYVAVTRAKRTLIITKNITNILTLAGEYFLRSELTSALLQDGQPTVCSIRECQNRITSESAIAMCKLPLKYMESEDAGGPLCESCVWQRLGPTACLLAPLEKLQSLPQTQERLELPTNYALLLALF